MKKPGNRRWQFLTTAKATIAVIFLCSAAFTFAQVPKKISAGVINGKVVKMPRLEYPPAARIAHASGAVNVQVTVDETGKVISAVAVSGHPLLRSAAEQAAKQAEFKPFMLKDEVVKASGILVFNFVPDEGVSSSGKGETMPAPAQKEETQPQTNNVDQATDETADNTDCSFEKYPAVKASDKFSNALIKSVFYEFYDSQANTGGLTSPGEIGVTFLKIQIGKAYANTITVVPGRGAQRKQDGAPVDAAIYPFKAIYIVCEKYAKETVKKQYENDFVCFKDRTGNWSCPPNGVPKITYPK